MSFVKTSAGDRSESVLSIKRCYAVCVITDKVIMNHRSFATVVPATVSKRSRIIPLITY